MKYYKIFNKDECHNGLQYHNGINEDILPFNPHGSCRSGGMYYTRKDVLFFLSYGPWLREVSLCKDSQIYKDTDKHVEKWKADKFFLKPRIKIDACLVQKLIDEGANVHAGGNEALLWSSCEGHSEIVKILLEAGADVHALDDESLRFASTNGRLEIVKALLKAGANVHALDDESLRHASTNGHLEIVKLLLENGADVHIFNNETLNQAKINKHLEIVEFLKNYIENE